MSSGRRIRATLLTFAASAMLGGATATQTPARPVVRDAEPPGPSPGTPIRVAVSSDFAVLLVDGVIHVETAPLDGENPVEFSRRVARDAVTAKKVLEQSPSARKKVLLSYGALSDETRRAAVAALFPSDRRILAGWLHVAATEESLASIASWFTGNPALGEAIAAENGVKAESVPRGTLVRIRTGYLLAPFRDADVVSEEEAERLEMGSDEKGRHAIYRLKPKEALYSAVVVRFTGRLHAEDVVTLALQIAERNGIEDVHAIPVGFPVKIPLEYLSPEFLPRDDPRAEAYARERAEASQFSRSSKAVGLAGVRIVIDAGHGGRDTGTVHKGVWESTYVYDVAVRLRKSLLERTKADVVMTSREPHGFAIVEKDALVNRRSRVLLTEPPYPLEDPTVGVNLRWYMANALLRKPGPDRRRIPPEKTVFLSIHADSLHPSVRGAMAYVPGERFLRERYGKSAAVYAVYREYRDQPSVSFTKKDRVSSEGVSTVLAEKLLGAMKASGLPVHRFSPVRTHVIRGGQEWVPAVLRYNRIPNRVLLEMANLSNEDDRALVLTRAFRQRVADSLVEGLLEFFGQPKELAGPGTASAVSATSAVSTGSSVTAGGSGRPAPPGGPNPALELLGPWLPPEPTATPRGSPRPTVARAPRPPAASKAPERTPTPRKATPTPKKGRRPARRG